MDEIVFVVVEVAEVAEDVLEEPSFDILMRLSSQSQSQSQVQGNKSKLKSQRTWTLLIV